MLQKAQETASTADSKMFGVEGGIVTNAKDDQKLGRIKVCFPRLPGKPESDWVRVSQPAAGAGRGFYWIPHVNDEVLLAFERGEAHRPYVVASLWNGKDKPMEKAYEDENTTIMIQTKSGHQIVMSDKDIQLFRLGHPDDVVVCSKCDGSDRTVEPGDPAAQSRFARFTAALGLSLVPPAFEPAHTTGQAGFEIGFSGHVALLNLAPSEWPSAATQATSAAPKLLVLPTLSLRKGLGGSVELGASASL